MNIAFGALILLLLLFPGILFRFAYLNGPYSRRNLQTSVSDEVLLSLIPAFILQSLAFSCIDYLFKIQVNIGLLVRAILGTLSQGNDFDLLGKAVVPFFIFNLVMFIIGYLAGKFARYIVMKNNWDMKYHSLKFNNEWYYLLSGKIPDESGVFVDHAKVQLVQLDVLVESSEGTVIYSGILQTFYLSKTEGLDRIHLSNVYRRKLKDDVPPTQKETDEKAFDARYYSMPGDLFVIPYNQIKNLNITYYYTEETD